MIGSFFQTLFIAPTLNVLLFFYHAFLNFQLPGAFGWAIIALVSSLRIVLNPLYHHQVKFQKKMSDLKPHMDELSKRHKDDKKKLSEAQMSLYKEHGINPATGCLVGLLQLPIMFGLYNVLNLFLSNGGLNHLAERVNKLAYIPYLHVTNIDPIFFGLNLSVSPSAWQKLGWYYLAIPVVTGILQYFQVAMMTPASPPKSKETDGKKKSEPGMQEAMNSQMKIMFPLMIGFASYQFPLGLSLYWNLFSIFTILTNYQVNKSHQSLALKS